MSEREPASFAEIAAAGEAWVAAGSPMADAVDKPSAAEVRDTEVRLFLSGVRRSVADHVNSLVFGAGMTTAEACEAVRTETERVLTLMGKEKGETRGDS